MPRLKRSIVAIDCETDPFKYERVPEPFIWGAYDGKDFRSWRSGAELLDYYRNKNVYLFAHNGGKFDFMFLLRYVRETRVRLINSRIVEMRFGRAILRDSWSILPMPLAGFRKTSIDYTKLEEENRDANWPEIVNYLEDDCRDLHELVAAYFSTAGTKATIASNALAFARKLGIDPGRTNHRYDENFRAFYFGGRVQCFQPGTHKNVHLLDIKSAYPFAMCHDHPSGGSFVTRQNLDGLSRDEICRAFIEVICHSKGAFPFKTKKGLSFPDMVGRFFVTGWEYLTARKHNLINADHRIERVYTLERTINFTDYVSHWFEHKQKADREGDKAQRIVGKFMLNSLYGKLAQNPIHYYDYHIWPAGTIVDRENGWTLGPEFEGLEIHERPVLYKYQQKYGNEWMKFPIHYNVATGASITGFTRAHLLDAIHTVGADRVIYCDTDCLFIGEGTEQFKLRMDNELGAWEWQGVADPCYIAGKKLYGLKFVNGPDTGKEKISSKGARLTLENLRDLCNGLTIDWRNEAPTFSLGRGASFIKRRIRATALME